MLRGMLAEDLGLVGYSDMRETFRPGIPFCCERKNRQTSFAAAR